MYNFIYKYHLGMELLKLGLGFSLGVLAGMSYLLYTAS